MATVGEAYVRIIPDASGFAAGLKSEVDGALKGIEDSVSGVGDKIKDEFEAPLEDTKERVKGVGEEFKQLGKLIGAAAVGRAVVNFAKDSIAAASDLSESINAVQVTFGELSDEILAFSENSATAVGLSSADFNSFAVRFAGFTKVIATDGKNAAQVTSELTTRIADFASVMNLDLNEAATVFASTLAGESEAIRRFGIDMSAASIEAFALEKGLIANKNEMTAAIKVQATYAKLMQDTAQVAGDFANTSDGLANQQRILNAQFEDLQATVGAALIPVLQSLIGIVQPLFEAFMALPDPIQQVIAISAIAAGGFWALSTAIQAVGVSAVVANPIILGVTAAIGAAVVVYKLFTDGNKRAKADQERLTQALTDANDPTWTLINSMKNLVAEINKLKPDEAADGIDEFAGTVGFARENLIDFLTPIEESGVGLSRLAHAASSGTDAFYDVWNATVLVGRSSQKTTDNLDELRKGIENNTRSGDPLRQMLIDLAESGALTVGEFNDLLLGLDRTADAFDGNRAAAQKTSEEFIRSAEFANAYATVFDDKLLGALIDSANASGDWVGALREAETALAEAGYVIDPTTQKLLSLSTAEGQAALEARGLAGDLGEIPGALAAVGFAWDDLRGTLTFQQEFLNVEQQIEDFGEKWAGVTAEARAQSREYQQDVINIKLALLSLGEETGRTVTLAQQNRIKLYVDTFEVERAMTLIRMLKEQSSNVGGPFAFPGPENIDWNKIQNPNVRVRANGGLITAPEFALIGEAGPEVVIPLTRPQRAMELMRQTGLDAMIGGRRGGAAVNIENAVFQDATDANLVAQKVNAAELSRSFAS